MGDMADFANEYQDSTMDEYYGYFGGTIDIPYGEQVPEPRKEFELPISHEEVSSFLERVDTLGISQAYPTNLTTSEPPTTKKVALNSKAVDNLKKDSPTCNICEESMASRTGKYGKFYYCINHCSGQKTVSESYWLSIKKAAGVSKNKNDTQEDQKVFFDDGFLWKFGGNVNIHGLTKQDGFTRKYTNKVKGGVYTVVTVAKASGDIKNGGFGPIIVYKNECGDLFSRSLRNFEDFMSPID